MKIEFENDWKNTNKLIDFISIRYDWDYPIGEYNSFIDFCLFNFCVTIYWRKRKWWIEFVATVNVD